ncbi:MAG: EcsC family protein [Lutispora sp.]|nr:EcsC family protein [Lutispora sp.]
MINNLDDKQNGLEQIIDWVISVDSLKTETYVNTLRKQNPAISNEKLAKKILNRKSFKNGLVGAATGLGGLLILPVAVPTDLAFSWRIQAYMAFSIAYVYGHAPQTTDLKTDLYLILAGDSAKEVLKRFGIEASKAATKKVVDRYITKEVMQKIWKVLGQKIITKAGEKSFTSFAKMIPIIGAPVGFVFDWVSTLAVGHFAIKYYKG